MESEKTNTTVTIRTAGKNELLLDDNGIRSNTQTIEAEAEAVIALLGYRLESSMQEEPDPEGFDKSSRYFALLQHPQPVGEGPYADLIRRYNLTMPERVMLALTVLPHYAPERLIKAMANFIRGLVVAHSGAGGFITQETHRFIPTLSTVFFICNGYEKMAMMRNFVDGILHGSLVKEQIIRFHRPLRDTNNNSDIDLVPQLAGEYVHHLLFGREVRPDFGDDFPARKIEPSIDVERKLVLPVHTAREVGLLRKAIEAVDISLSKGKKVRGMPVLFFGRPGTGKTLTASSLGLLTGRPVFKIDLAQIVSKYIGETEKRLASVFDRADGKNWILFFDEADSLFAKRTGVSDAHDRYANLLTSYLLQRMEDYAGVSILSTNLRQNIDQAMTRRFVQVIGFPEPDHAEREKLWKTALPEGFDYEEGMQIKTLAQAELTGANIAMILKNCMLHSTGRHSSVILGNDIKYWTLQEFAKQGISPRMRSWPNEKKRGFRNPKPLADPLFPDRNIPGADPESFVNINLFED